MELIFNRIKNLCLSKKITIRELCKKIGITTQGFYNMVNTNTMKVETLINISKTLNVNIYYFFASEAEKFSFDNDNVNSDENEKIEKLKTILEKYIKQMKSIKEENELLKKMNENLRKRIENEGDFF